MTLSLLFPSFPHHCPLFSLFGLRFLLKASPVSFLTSWPFLISHVVSFKTSGRWKSHIWRSTTSAEQFWIQEEKKGPELKSIKKTPLQNQPTNQKNKSSLVNSSPYFLLKKTYQILMPQAQYLFSLCISVINSIVTK